MRAARVLGLTLAAAMVVLFVLLRGQWDYTINNGTVVVTRFRGLTDRAVIPDAINGLPVTRIENATFQRCTRLTKVTIPNGVTNIGEQAFEGCAGLTTIAIPDSVVGIGMGAFRGCSKLTSVTLPVYLTTIADSLFCQCISLTNVTIPETVRVIEYGGFMHCSNLNDVTIPASVRDLGMGCGHAFAGCTRLTNVYFKGNAPTLGFMPAFEGATNATIYYIEGTKGWGKEFGGRPTAVWKKKDDTVTNGVPMTGVER